MSAGRNVRHKTDNDFSAFLSDSKDSDKGHL